MRHQWALNWLETAFITVLFIVAVVYMAVMWSYAMKARPDGR